MCKIRSALKGSAKDMGSKEAFEGRKEGSNGSLHMDKWKLFQTEEATSKIQQHQERKASKGAVRKSNRIKFCLLRNYSPAA